MNRGFTLIEMVIYIALLSLVITCSFEALGSAGSASATASASANALMEGTFASEKIAYAYAHAAGVSVSLSSGSLMLTEEGRISPITSANVSVSELHVPGSEEGRELSFLVNGVMFSTSIETP